MKGVFFFHSHKKVTSSKGNQNPNILIKLLRGWLDYLSFLFCQVKIFLRRTSPFHWDRKKGIIGASQFTIKSSISCWNNGEIFKVLLSSKPCWVVNVFLSRYGSGGDANRSYLRYVRFVISYHSVFSFGEITHSWSHVKAQLKPQITCSFKSLSYVQVHVPTASGARTRLHHVHHALAAFSSCSEGP